MKHFFPKHSVQWHFEEPTVLRKFSLSLVEMALLTGVTLRLFRALVMSYSGGASVLWLAGTAVGFLLLCLMATVHLANYPIHRWVWRAPLFAFAEIAAGSLTALFLIWLGREPNGSIRAEWKDWLPMTGDTVWTHELVVCGWALILAGAVTLVRRTILRDERVEEEPVEDAAQA